MSIKVHGADVEFMKFSAGEPHVKVTNIGEHVRVIWKFENFEEFMSVAMICEIIKDRGCVVDLEIPYIPFGRQDRKTSPEQPFSLEIFCKMLKTLKITTLCVDDSHSNVFFELMAGSPFIVKYHTQIQCAALTLPMKYFMPSYTIYDCVIAPDKGAVSKAGVFSYVISKPLVCATKVRDPLTGQLSSPTIDFGDLKPKHALIPDDILDYGGTFIQLANEVKKQFPDIKLDLYVTHGIFAGGVEKFKGLFENIYCYNIMNKGITSGDLVNLSGLS